MFRKLQKSAAALGADGVIVTGQGVSHFTLPGYATTSSSATTFGTGAANMSGNAVRTGPGSYNVTGYGMNTYSSSTLGSAQTVYSPPQALEYPRIQGIAIKFVSPTAAPKRAR